MTERVATHRVRRLIGQLALLVILMGVNLLSEDLFLLLVAVALVLAPPISITVALVLVWTARQAPNVQSLQERADDAVTLALIASAGAGAAAVALGRIFGVDFDLGRPALVLLSYGFILVTIPALDWLRTWRDVWVPMVTREREETETDG